MGQEVFMVKGNNMFRIVVFAFAATTLVSIPSARADQLPTAKPEEVGMSAEKLSLVVPAMQKLVDEKKVAGAITIAAKDGKVILFETVGSKNADTNEPMTRDTIVRIYSMPKPITSVAIMMLVEAGKLDLDDPVAKHLPELRDVKVFAGVKDGDLQLEEAQRAMTIRDLMRHTSGLTYGVFGDTPVDVRYRAVDLTARSSTLAEMITKLGKLPLLYQPGTRFNYGVSTDVLGRIVEVTSGESFDDFLQARIFVPLDMKDTGFFVPEDKLARFAANHSPRLAGGLRVTDLPATSRYRKDPPMLSGGGGLVSTARDYVRFCQMLLNKGEFAGQRLLREETVVAMTKNQLPDEAYPLNLNGPRPGVGFGLGFSVVTEATDYTLSSHVGEYGWGGAASTHFWISPNDKLAVVVLTQLMPFSFQMEQGVKPLIYDAFVAPE